MLKIGLRSPTATEPLIPCTSSSHTKRESTHLPKIMVASLVKRSSAFSASPATDGVDTKGRSLLTDAGSIYPVEMITRMNLHPDYRPCQVRLWAESVLPCAGSADMLRLSLSSHAFQTERKHGSTERNHAGQKERTRERPRNVCEISTHARPEGLTDAEE